jgi:hypothetical protein
MRNLHFEMQAQIVQRTVVFPGLSKVPPSVFPCKILAFLDLHKLKRGILDEYLSELNRGLLIDRLVLSKLIFSATMISIACAPHTPTHTHTHTHIPPTLDSMDKILYLTHPHPMVTSIFLCHSK